MPASVLIRIGVHWLHPVRSGGVAHTRELRKYVFTWLLLGVLDGQCDLKCADKI